MRYLPPVPMKRLRKAGGEDLFYFRDGSKQWVIRDAAVLAEVERILEPILQLGEKQGGVGEKLGARGEKQEPSRAYLPARNSQETPRSHGLTSAKLCRSVPGLKHAGFN